MPEALARQAATRGFGGLPPDSGFTLCENPTRGLWWVQPARDRDLAEFIAALFGDAPRSELIAARGDLRLLRLWPHQALLLGDAGMLPPAAGGFEPILTDVGHAYSELWLEGRTPLDPIAAYCTVDPRDPDRDCGALRCRLGHYPVTLWWESGDRLQLIVERPLALSFANHLAALTERWRISPTW